MTYFMSISIGPVQEFIASARRSRDLWFSSWMLSELSKTAAIAIAEMATIDGNNGELVFPFPNQQSNLYDDRFTVANVIAAVVDDPHQVAEKIDSQLKARLQIFANLALSEVDAPERNLNTLQIAYQQIQDLVECIWAATPIQAGNYITARRQTLALLAARKGTRNFPGIPWQRREGIPKSSLDGRRESVIPESRYPNVNDSLEVKRHKTSQLYRLYKAGAAERLSGVDLLKRLGSRNGEDIHFPSTSHIASQPFLHRLKKLGIEATTQFDAFIYSLKSQGFQPERVHGQSHDEISYDGSILFTSRIKSLAEDQDLGEAVIESAQKTLSNFLSTVDIGVPAPYYALLIADGDRMGKVIDAQGSVKEHQKLSATLSLFAKTAKTTVVQYEGELIYAGGDDVLALLPLHTVLECTRQLAQQFYTQMIDYVTVDQEHATLSAGIAICHHLEPLSDALNLARNTEQIAKRFPGKNAVAIAVDKRSGAGRTIVGPLLSNNEEIKTTSIPPLIERQLYFAGAHRQERIPDGAAYQIRDLSLRLTVHKSDPIFADLQAAIRADALRILDRGQAQRGRQAISTEIKDYIRALLQSIPDFTLEEGMKDLLSNRNWIDVEQLADELIIAREFANAKDVAYGKEL